MKSINSCNFICSCNSVVISFFKYVNLLWFIDQLFISTLLSSLILDQVVETKLDLGSFVNFVTLKDNFFDPAFSFHKFSRDRKFLCFDCHKLVEFVKDSAFYAILILSYKLKVFQNADSKRYVSI
jgi:hypothetical protein